MNRLKALVLALFAVYWVIVVVILVAARQVYDQTVRLPGNQRSAEIGVLLLLTALFAVLSTGVILQLALDLLANLGRLHGRHLACARFRASARWDRTESRSCLVCGAPGGRWPDPVCHRAGNAGRLPQDGHLGRILTAKDFRIALIQSR